MNPELTMPPAAALAAGDAEPIAAFDTAEAAMTFLRQSGIEPMACAVVTDDPSQAIRLTLYADDGHGATVPFSPHQALRIAGELIQAAARRIAG